MLDLALVVASLLVGLVAAFATRGRPSARLALGAGIAALAGNVLSFVFC